MLPRDVPDSPAVGLLKRLLDRHERGQAARWARIDLGDIGGRGVDDAHHVLEHAERVGAIEIARARRASHVLERVRLADADVLADLVGRRRTASVANGVLDVVAPLLSGSAEWIQDEFEGAFVKWNRGERALRLEAGEVDRIVDLVRILIALDRGVDGRDLRSFSVDAGVSSKTFEGHRGTIADIARRAYGLHGMDADQVLSMLGFRPFHHPVHVCGPIVVPPLGLDCRMARPYVALPPDAAGDLVVVGTVRAVLTIENFASFNRHVNEVDQPDVVVVYGGGFASPPVLKALRTLLDQASGSELHHWGDIDAGGVRIFRNLEERLGVTGVPHLMNEQVARAAGAPRPAVSALSRIAATDSGIASLAGFLASLEAHHLEQEALSPVPLFRAERASSGCT